MTNYEWLLKNYDKLVKNILSRHLGKVKGMPISCLKTDCVNCDFESKTHFPCCVKAREWLNEEHEPLYRKGDIVITSYDELVVIKEDDPIGNTIAVSNYIHDECIAMMPITDIKKKVGHIDINEPSLCASCKSEECILQTGIVRKHCDFYKA